MTTLDVEPLRIRTDEYDRMTEVGLFSGRRIELLAGTLYEMPPMRTPHLTVAGVTVDLAILFADLED